MTYGFPGGVVAESVLAVAALHCLDKAGFSRSLREDDCGLDTIGTHGQQQPATWLLVHVSQNRDVGAFERPVQGYDRKLLPIER